MEILQTLSAELVVKFGHGYLTHNLVTLARFAEACPDEKIVSALWGQVCWSQFKELIYLEKPLQHDFYAEINRSQEIRGLGRD